MSDSAPAGEGKAAQGAAPAWRRRLLFAALGLAVVGGLGWLFYYYGVAQFAEETSDAYVAGDLVGVTPQQAGRVVAVNIANTQFVAKGALLVLLDADDAKVELDRAKAKLGSAVRSVAGLFDSAGADQANIASAEAAFRQTEQDVGRARRLQPENAMSLQDLQHAEAAYAAAKAALDRARNQRDANLKQIVGTTIANNPSVLAAVADLRAAWLAVARTEIRSPVAGFVSQKNVQVGAQIDPSVLLLTIVPLDEVWVDANFKETQVEDIRIGQPATLAADIYGSGVAFHGRVLGRSAGTGNAFSLLPPENATGNWIKVVQRLPMRIGLDAKEIEAHPLSIGLSMTVTIDTHKRDGQVMSSAPVWAAQRTTNIYDAQSAGVDDVIRTIVEANLPGATVKP